MRSGSSIQTERYGTNLKCRIADRAIGKRTRSSENLFIIGNVSFSAARSALLLVSINTGPPDEEGIQISLEVSGVFISILSVTTNDVCKDR